MKYPAKPTHWNGRSLCNAREIEKTAKLATVTGYWTLGDPLGTSVAERDLLLCLFLSLRDALARVVRKILDYRDQPTAVQADEVPRLPKG